MAALVKVKPDLWINPDAISRAEYRGNTTEDRSLFIRMADGGEEIELSSVEAGKIARLIGLPAKGGPPPLVSHVAPEKATVIG